MENKLPLKANLYFSAVILAGAITFFLFIQKINFYNFPWLDIFFFFFITLILVFYPLVLLSKVVVYWLDDIPVFAALFLYGSPTAIMISSSAVLIHEIYRLIKALIAKKGKIQYRWIIVNFSNPARSILTIGIAGLVYNAINQNSLILTSFKNILAVTVFALTRFFLDSIETSLGIYFYSEGIALKKIWQQNYSKIIHNLLMVTPLSAVLAFLYVKQTLLVVFLSIPVIAMYISIESFRNIIKQTQETLNVLAKTIDQRDHSTYGHSERVAKISKAIAQYMGFEDARISLVEKAGKIHDLGKIGIPDKILQKPKELTEEELEIMKSHPGAIQKLFYDLKVIKKYLPVDIAAMHHERYDGAGYSLGLKGEEIPLEARILSVADAFDAMTSDRAYRGKFTEEAAAENIIEGTGKQFDPLVVEAFIHIYKCGRIKQIKDEWEEKEKIYLKKNASYKIEEKFKNFSS